MRLNITKIHRTFIANWIIVSFSILVFIGLRLLGSKDLYSIQCWITTIIQIGIAFFLFFLSQTYGIVRQKPLLPAFFYLLFVGTNPLLFDNLSGSILTILIIICFFLLFATYQNVSPQLYTFNIAILIMLGSLYWFPLLLFFPLFWYGMYLLKSFNYKSFFSYFLGIFVVYMSLWISNIIIHNNLNVFLKKNPFDDLQIVCNFFSDPKQWIAYGFWTIFLFFSGLKVFLLDISKKIRTIMILRYLWILSCVLSILSLIQNQWKSEWLLILYSFVSLLIAHFFTFSQKKSAPWLLLVVVISFFIIVSLENILERFTL